MRLFWEDRKAFLHFANKVSSPFHVNLNLGGGPDFVEWRWINLDGAPGRYNQKPFAFGSTVRLPFRDRRFRKVYTSHFLEHLLEETARRTLLETCRVMRGGADLIVKIPDYDAALLAWNQREGDFFSDDKWNFSAVTHTWARRGIEDNLTNRALMIFCGYWNSEYGDPFARDIKHSDLAFHGPPKLSDTESDALLVGHKPSEIARSLHRRVEGEDAEAQFNHQAAWSRDEFVRLLGDCGLELVSTDKVQICEKHADVPGIRSMFEVSAYYWAKK